MDTSLFFFIKKTAGLFILPSSLILFLLISGFLLSLKKNLRITSKILFFAGISLFFLLSLPTVIQILLLPLSDVKASKNINKKDDIKSIVVLLGGANYDYKNLSDHELSPASKLRAIKAVELANDKNLKSIYLSGGCGKALKKCPISEAEVAEKFLKNKVKNSDVILESKSDDTYTNLKNIKKLINNEPFYLITSPTHIRRSMLIAEHFNLKAYPVISNNIKKPEMNIWELWPAAENLYLADLIFHEYYGIILFYLKEKL